MAIYIGGDTQELEYDFGLKVAGSVVECPMKIYKAEVDPAALPAPTDVSWTEVTSQTVLDKLKVQNEIPVSAIATDKSTVTWNGKTLPKTTTLKVVDDFAGKVAGSVVENPHLAKNGVNLTLESPTSVNYGEVELAAYSWINTLNGTLKNVSSSVSGGIPEQLFSFNIIEMFERKYGAIPKETVAEKVAWLKSNLSQITPTWYGYGSCPLGNKAYLRIYNVTNSSYNYWGDGYGQTYNTSSSSTKLSYFATSDIASGLDLNGFVHYLAYTDAARTTDSTLLVLTGHGLSQWDIVENTTRNMISAFGVCTTNTIVTATTTGQVAGDTIKKYHWTGTDKTLGSGANETTVVINNHGLVTGDRIRNHTRGNIDSVITVIDTNTFTCNTPIAGQVNGDSVSLYKYTGIQIAESTVIPSTIYTDYVSLELTLKAPENLITATNTLSDIVTDFNDTYNIGKYYQHANSLLNPNNVSFAEDSQAYVNQIKTLNGDSFTVPSVGNMCIPQQLFSFNIVSAVEKQLGQPIPAVDKVQWCKDNLNSVKCAWYGYGSCPSGNKAYIDIWNVNNSSYHWKSNGVANNMSNVSSSPTLINLTISDGTHPLFIDTNGFVHFLAYTDASDGVTASTIYTDYIKLTIKLKYIPTYDFYTDSNTRRDAGLTDIVLVKRSIGDMTSDFVNKVSGSVVENPNISKYNNWFNTLQTPTGTWTEINTGAYVYVNSLNGTSYNIPSPTTNGLIAQQLFQFNLIEIAQRQLGTSIPGADTASKVQWLKDNLASVWFRWYGYGSCPSGNKSYVAVYNNVGSNWQGVVPSTASTPTEVIHAMGLDFDSVWHSIDSNGFVNYLAYTDSSNGTIASVINTDYVKLTLTFKTDTVGYEYFTNNSTEVSVTTANKASALLIECDLTPIANALYGGSNAALKSALKSIQADVYAMGSGANVNQLGYGVKMYIGYGYGSNWDSNVSLQNNSSSILNTSIPITTQTTSSFYVSTLNKFYLLITSLYKSDGSIASEVNLDYAKIKVSLSRVPDVISNPPTINLTDKWSILVRGFSPSWDSTDAKNREVFVNFKDTSNWMQLYWGGNENKCFVTNYKINNSLQSNLTLPPITFNKYQILNLLFVANGTNRTLYALKNNGDFIKASDLLNKDFTGLVNLMIEGYNETLQADAFLDSIVYMPNQVWDDTEAEAILRGTKEGFEFPELFDINAVTLHANATRSNGVITLNASEAWENSFVTIPVLPNNKYEIKCDKNISGAYSYVVEYHNNTLLKNEVALNYYPTNSDTFITSSRTNSIIVRFGANAAGTFTFSNISLKLKM